MVDRIKIDMMFPMVYNYVILVFLSEVFIFIEPIQEMVYFLSKKEKPFFEI
jgi:hypothetical protein